MRYLGPTRTSLASEKGELAATFTDCLQLHSSLVTACCRLGRGLFKKSKKAL